MNSRSEKFRTIDRRHLWHPYSKHSVIQRDDFPIIVHGQGPYLFDCDGRRYFDAISSWWCCNLGHSHPRLVKAIKTQVEKLQHSILGNMSHPPAIELAEKLAGLFPDKRRRVFFSSDGSSAVEAALKIAVQYWHNIGQPKRCRLVSMAGAYHGDTLGAVSAGYLPGFHRPFRSLLFPVYRAAAPDCGGCTKNPYIMNESFIGKIGRAQARPLHDHPDTCDCECFKSMRNIIEKHSGEIAAVIIEPLCQCAAGMRIYPPAYLQKLSHLCRARKILLIADEIAVGFGRTGTMFAFEQAGIDPDIVCLGKSLGGGYLPISATVVKENIYAAFADSSPFAKATGDSAKIQPSQPEALLRRSRLPRGLPLGVSPTDHTFYHGHTFAGNPIACAAALEVLKIYDEEKIVLTVRRKGRMMAKKMAALQSVTGIKNVRSLGMISAVELALEKNNKISRAQMIKKGLMQKGVLIRPLGNVIYLMPPLNTPENIFLDTVDLLAKTLEEAN